MIPIKIDISSVIDKFNLDQTQSDQLANAVVKRISGAFAQAMAASAKRKLKSPQAFIDAIKVSLISNNKASVELIGFLANAQNEGKSPFDMKIGFGNSAKRKHKKDGGWYLTIPFRIATPNAVATSSIFSGKMDNSVYNLAKKLNVRQSLPKGSLPSAHSDTKFRPAIETTDGRFEAYKHKAPLLEGLTKTGGGGNSQYMTFRRVSDKSDTDSWIHTGIIAKHIHLDAMKDLDIGSETKMVIDKFLDQL